MIASKQEMVYQKIKEHILIGKLKNNTRITERGLAENMNVTRVPIRESLVKLEQDGLIKKIPSVGYIVDNYSVEEFEEALLMRFVIECQAAGEAARVATPEDITELRKFNEAMKNAGHAGNLEVVIESDRKFHLAIVKASRSKIFNKMYSIISIPVFNYRQEGEASTAIMAFEGHNEIIQAIENNDAETAFTTAVKYTPGRNNFKNKFYSDIAQKILLNID
jgi:DNA-binding GntR family transcriptional regulator